MRELYGNILEAYQQEISQGAEKGTPAKTEQEMPEFSVTVTPYEEMAAAFVVLPESTLMTALLSTMSVSYRGKDKLFVAMPAYKTKQVDEQGKAIYQDVAYPVTKEFREKLYGQDYQ